MLRDDIAEFRRLHAASRARVPLAAHHLERYAVLSARLFQTVLAAQNEAVLPRHRLRAGVRVRRALRVELSWGRDEHRAVTVDVGIGGFAALLGATPPRSTSVLARLCLSSSESMVLVTRVVAARERRGTVRVSFAFEELSDVQRGRLEAFLVDDALAEVTFAAARKVG